MITKTGRALVRPSRYFEKRGNFILGHALQNLAGRALMRYPDKLGLEKMFLRGMVKPGEGMSTYKGNAMLGVGQGAMPELAILNEKFNHMGTKFEEALKRHGINKSDLTNRDIVALRRAMRGDIVKAVGSRAPAADKAVMSLLESIDPNIKSLVDSGMITPGLLRGYARKAARGINPESVAGSLESCVQITPEQAGILMEGIGRTFKENRLLGNLVRSLDTRSTARAYPDSKLMPGFLRGRRKKGLAQKLREAQEGDEDVISMTLRRGGTLLGEGAITAVDPGTGALNAVKYMADAPWLGKIKPGRIVQENLQDIFVSQPLAKSYQKGMAGNYVQPFRVEKAPGELLSAVKGRDAAGAHKKLKDYVAETVDAQAFNPMTSAAKHLSNGIGAALHDAGITQAQINEALAKGGERFAPLRQPFGEKKHISKAIDAVKETGRNTWDVFTDGIRNIPGLLR